MLIAVNPDPGLAAACPAAQTDLLRTRTQEIKPPKSGTPRDYDLENAR